MIFPENIGPFISIDEVSLSQGELYTFITNKAGKGKKGTLIASIKGAKSKDIIDVLHKLPNDKIKIVKEVTLDMAKNMELAIKTVFPNVKIVTDRFHVVKLVIEALQHIRIKNRWNEIDKENEAIANAKEHGNTYFIKVLDNGDTPKQLLARSRYLLFKNENRWTKNQQHRAQILFKEFPQIKIAYKHAMELRSIYDQKTIVNAKDRFINWIGKSIHMESNEFFTTAHTIYLNLDNILNFFKYRNTNANAESFNAKIKLFRANLRGVSDPTFFLFRLSKLFA